MARILHLRCATRTGAIEELSDFLREAVPFYESLQGVRVQLLRNVDEPSRYIEVITYETTEAFDLDRARVEGDPQMQALLERWRSLLAPDITVETYDDVTETIRQPTRLGE